MAGYLHESLPGAQSFVEDLYPTKVAIIGAGSSGLTAIKCCLEEGLTPVCFELSGDIGGLWNFTEATPSDDDRCNASVYASCSINTSKEMMAFSDFPIPVDFPPFMPHDKVLEYFRMYASHFKLLPHIRFRNKVLTVAPSTDHKKTGRWVVSSCDLQSNTVQSEIFDGVMVCSGHHRFPHEPHMDGLAKFKGTVLHSSEYKTQEVFKNKNVLVVGMGNSAADIATDASYVAKKVDVSTRRGSWIFSRFFPGGLPADFLANTRFMMGVPTRLLQWMVELMVNFKYSGENYGLMPSHRGLQAHPTIHDYFTIRIMSGYIRMRPSITHFTTDGAVFDNGHFEELDTVVMATGYDYKFPFLTDEILYGGENSINAFKFTFLPHLDHPETLCFVGLVQAIGAVMPIAELQARWFAQIMKGKCRLPSQRKMDNYIMRRKISVQENYISSHRHDTLETFWVEAMDEIAREFGARPSTTSLLLEDPLFAVRCYFGPCVPAQYRLQGPHKKPEMARRMIENCFTNITKSTQTRKIRPPELKDPAMTWSQRLVSLKVLLYTLTFVFAAFLMNHLYLI